MLNIPFLCLPETTEYISATQISHRGKTRFNISTTLRDPNKKRFYKLKRPIESILLYHYKTSLNSVTPVPLVNYKLTQVDLGLLNQSNAENPAVNTHTSYRKRPCFSFTSSNSGELEDGWIIQLPKLVLARDLFFSHPYLLRAALFSESYTTDVLVDHDDPKAFHIFIAPNKKITSKDMNDPIFLQKLALILLHPELKNSFLSIYKKTIRDQAPSKAYDFDLDAPALKNIQLDVDGCIYPNKRIFRIERINTFENLETAIHKPVQFHFLSKKTFGRAKDILDGDQQRKKQESQNKSKLDDKANADIDQPIAQLRNILGKIYTLDDLKISLNTSCTEINTKRRIAKGNSHFENQPFAGGEGEDEGTRSGFTIESVTDRESTTYNDFSNMLKEIEKKQYKVKNLHHDAFTKFGRFRGHKLNSGQNRRFYVSIILDCNDNELFYLCKIDTSDGKKNISTLLLPFEVDSSQKMINGALKAFKIAILSQSLNWPKDFLSEIYNIKSYMMINHLSKKEHAISNTYHADWAKRILEKWKSMQAPS